MSIMNTYRMQFRSFNRNFSFFLAGKMSNLSMFRTTGSFPKCLMISNAFWSADTWCLTESWFFLLIRQVTKLLTSPMLECWVVMMSPVFNNPSSFDSYWIQSLTCSVKLSNKNSLPSTSLLHKSPSWSILNGKLFSTFVRWWKFAKLVILSSLQTDSSK